MFGHVVYIFAGQSIFSLGCLCFCWAVYNLSALGTYSSVVTETIFDCLSRFFRTLPFPRFHQLPANELRFILYSHIMHSSKVNSCVRSKTAELI